MGYYDATNMPEGQLAQQYTIAGGFVLDPAADPQAFHSEAQQRFLHQRAAAWTDVDVCLSSEIERNGTVRLLDLPATRKQDGLDQERKPLLGLADAVVASGEQVTAGLPAITLEGIGINARSWQGWQLPILTSNAHGSARILEINGAELIKRFKERKQVAVISGFQGIHKDTGRITTLGRGGSDTSAVAIAAAIQADRCDIYTDVDGVYTTDPRMVPRAKRMDKIAFEEMLEFASLGAKVLQVRSVELGMLHKVKIFVRSSFDRPEDIDPHGTPPGTLICDEEDIVEQQTVTGIAFSKDEAQISVRHVPDKPGIAAAIFGPLADANINVDMIVQNVSADGATTDLTFTVPAADYQRSVDVLNKSKSAIGFDHLDGSTDVAKVSVIGIGMRSHAGVAAEAFKALAGRGVNIRAITTSEIKFSVLIDAAYTELAVRTLHTLYGLDHT
jgi:aspartate kinase